jgi:hypothetical protein
MVQVLPSGKKWCNYVTHHIAEQTFEKLLKIGRKVTVGHLSDFALKTEARPLLNNPPAGERTPNHHWANFSRF